MMMVYYRGDKIDYYMLYNPNLDYLCSNEAMLTQDQAERIRDSSRQNGKKATDMQPESISARKILPRWESPFANFHTPCIRDN